MTTTYSTQTAPTDDAADLKVLEDGRGADLALLAAMPVSHPSREALRARVIESWMPLARSLALRFNNRGESVDDLIQVAAVGLIKSVDRFDPERGIEFAGFAIPTIIGEIKRHFRDRTWDIRVPRRLQEMRLRINQASSELTTTLGRTPTVADLARHLECDEEQIIEGLEAGFAYSAVSLSTPLGGSDSGAELADTLGMEDADFETTELRVALGPALNKLDARERKIISLRFFGNLSQAQIAEQIGVSQMHVSRLLTKTLAKLRTSMSH